MRRGNRRRQREEVPPLDPARVLFGARRTEVRRGAEWTVQSMSAASAQKPYTCPGCAGTIEPGTAHVVAWRADSIFGDENAVAERRHWHRRCWEVSL